MPSSVHWPSLRSSSLPVAMVKVSGSITQIRLLQAVVVGGELHQAGGDFQLLFRRLRHAGLIDGWSAITAAPKRFANTRRFVRGAFARSRN